MTTRELAEKVETFVLDVINGKRRDRSAQIFSGFLFLASRLFRAIVQLRHTLYRKRIYRHKTLGCLVVSIGNITAGGTGKTPVTEVFARTLSAKGRRVAILSRGYRSKSKPFKEKFLDLFRSKKNESPPRVVSEGNGKVLLDSNMAGDEPYMLAKNLPDVLVLTDKSRVKSGRYAIRKYGVDTLIMDDGFQHLHLKPKINIMLVDSTNPFSNHELLPRGLLREPIKNMRRADFIFLTKSNGGKHLRRLKTFIRKHNPRAEIIECTHRPQYLRNLLTNNDSPLSDLKGKKVAAISGIAVPESFENFLTGLGAEIVYKKSYADHHRYRKYEIVEFLEESKKQGATMVITTEKDAVRFPELESHPVPTLYLRVEIDILSGEESFKDAISRICFS
ncbi:MAG: tetraacyldisaccharide 4'-kinase [Lentisphaeraceae bacterium]|nr:tetraacyldisaccharide 4'-kinase [Lentisphaeraceae bacterium]